MTFRTRLFSGFLFIAVIAALIGLLGVYSSKKIENDFKTAAKKHADLLSLQNQVMTYWHQALNNLDHFVVSVGAGIKEPSLQRDYLQSKGLTDTTYKKLVGSVSGDQKSELSLWQQNLKAAEDLADQTIARINNGESVAALSGPIAQVSTKTSEAEVALLTVVANEGGRFQVSLLGVEAATARSITIMLILIVIALLVAILLGYYISRAIAAPITKLTEATAELSAGNLGIKVEAESKDEIGDLAGSFNKMSSDLKESREGLMALAADLELRVEERTGELARSNAELEQFAYVASHDLQEPLRAVSSYAELLQMKYGEQLDDKAHKYLGHMIGGIERMQALINDLLVYSRVGTRGKEFKEADLNAMLAEALQNLEKSIQESGAVITHDDLPRVDVDASQIRQLLQNLIGNAVKFRGEGTPVIHVSAENRDGEWLFGVKDNGIGIDPKYSDRIFEIFQRLHGRAEYSGTGIGLSICRRIVERHGGHIWVESEPGQGATFFFTIPTLRGEVDE